MLPSSTSENLEQVWQSSNESNGPSQQEINIPGEQAAGAELKPSTCPESNVHPSSETKEADVKETNFQTSKLQASEAVTSTPSPSLTAKGWGLPNASMSMLPTLSLTSWFSSDKKALEAGNALVKVEKRSHPCLPKNLVDHLQCKQSHHVGHIMTIRIILRSISHPITHMTD
jgi:hypothetical protein